MVNNFKIGSNTASSGIDPNLDASVRLCEFSFEDQEFLALKICEDDDFEELFSGYRGYSFTEICRFNVNDCVCVIVKIAPNAMDDELNLSNLLSNRELQIASLVALGCPNKQVADKLRISEWTVASYLRRIFAKLRVDTRAAMTYRCASLIGKQSAALNSSTTLPPSNGLKKK